MVENLNGNSQQFWLEAPGGDKQVSAEMAISRIENGSRIFIGTGCGEPQHLIKSMVNDRSKKNMIIYQMLPITLADYMDDESFLKRFALKLFFISRRLRKAAFEGKLDYIPAYLSQIPGLFASHRIGLDVALVQVSVPDRFGYCSLGVSVDITSSGIENAKLVIAQVNPRMPRTLGDSFVHVDKIHYLVFHEEPLVESLIDILDNDISKRIGHYVSQLIGDGATIQIGFGQLPYTILKYLEDKKDLGVHTQLITDGFLPLFEKGVITNRKKRLLPGRVVASMCMGTKKLYDHINNNPTFYFRSSEFVNDPTVIARNDNMVSISSALEVDLTGQVNTDSIGYLFYSGIGNQVDFLRGTAMSKNGFSIIALPSTAQDGQISRIVASLSEGAGVATTRGDINFIVTEYGVAELQGKSIYQRVIELAQIAHPKFREDLIKVAKKHHYIFIGQLPPAKADLLFLENYKSSLMLPNGKTITFRPILPSDELASRNFIYSLKKETLYQRFFSEFISHEMVNKQWASIDYHNNMAIIGLVQRGGHKEIMAIGSYAKMNENTVEVGFVVREDFQGLGICSYLLRVLEKIARENEFLKFSATMLRSNKNMQNVFLKRFPDARLKYDDSEVYMTMNLAEAAD
ncbi:MAG: GNAT family N-acetyltransferase [Proteobacteria bacterium]|nr:GNAT family N-acetyltransferase [Pseudomonadota bacterium]